MLAAVADRPCKFNQFRLCVLLGRWVDDKWRVDMSGFDQEEVDADGWYYALDFNYLR